jgi:hypothetical protein
MEGTKEKRKNEKSKRRYIRNTEKKRERKYSNPPGQRVTVADAHTYCML